MKTPVYDGEEGKISPSCPIWQPTLRVSTIFRKLDVKKGASDHLEKYTGQGAPENTPSSQRGKRQHENEVKKREKRK